MCLLNNEIIQVSNTKILCAPDQNNNRQLTVYSNKVDSVENENSMVLPVPNPNSLKFHNLKDYSYIFDDCDDCFEKFIARSFKLNTNGLDKEQTLPIFNMGSYKVSVANKLSDLENANPNVFKLSDGLKEILNTYYYQPYWGFIICKLDKGLGDYHPFAYSHEMIDKKIYIPTRHYHKTINWSESNPWALGMPINPYENPLNMRMWNENNINNSPMFSSGISKNTTPEKFNWFKTNQAKSRDNTNTNTNNQNNNMADDWSHDIYLININPKTNKYLGSMNIDISEWNGKFLVDENKLNFPIGKCKLFQKINITGNNPNIDLVF